MGRSAWTRADAHSQAAWCGARAYLIGDDMDNGIDYGMGQTNIDPKTGIRFGVINMNALAHWAWDDVEANYGDPTCGKCGCDLVEYDDEKHGEYPEIRGCSDYACESCCVLVSSDDAFGDEPISHYVDDGEIKAEIDSHNDMMIVSSPYYTRGRFCSPCAPGAVHLENPTDDGAKAYCLGHDWFEDRVAPYTVWRVADDTVVEPEAK